MIIEKQFRLYTVLTKKQKVKIQVRTMFSFKNATKKIKDTILPMLKKTFSTQPTELEIIKSPSFKKNFAYSQEKHAYLNGKLLCDIWHVTLIEKYSSFWKSLENLKNSKAVFFREKFYHLANINNNFVLQQKITFIIGDKLTLSKIDLLKIIEKLDAFHTFQKINAENNPFYMVESDNINSTKAFYEFWATHCFAKNQPGVHSIMFKSEHPSSRTSDQQKLSQKMTGQKNSDVEITFKGKFTSKIKSLMDVKLGQKFHFKGNLIFTSLHDINRCYETIQSLKDDLNAVLKNKSIEISANDKLILDEALVNIEKIEKTTNITPQNKIVLIQQQIIQIIETARNYNPFFNPNLISFIPENENSKNNYELIEKIAQIPETAMLSHSSSDVLIKTALQKSLAIYLNHHKHCLEIMSPSHREHCLSIIRRFIPDYVYIESKEIFSTLL